EMHGGADRRHTHHFRTTPGDGPHVARPEIVCLDHGARRLLDLFARPGQLVVEQARGVPQTRAVRGKSKDAAVIDAFALEYRRAIVQRMGQDMSLRLAPWQQLSVKPKQSVAISHI